MKASRPAREDKTLDKFLADPAKTMPGTAMTRGGISAPQERRHVIADLRRASDLPECETGERLPECRTKHQR